MSYHYQGRYTHDHQEYERWLEEDRTSQLQARNAALVQDLQGATARADQARAVADAARNDVRRLSRATTLLQQEQRRLATGLKSLAVETREEFREVRAEIQRSHAQLEGQIGQVRDAFVQDRLARQGKERGLATEARQLARFVEAELATVEHVDPLELSAEREVVRQQLRTVEHTLQGPAPEQATNGARSALAAVYTLQVEQQRRLGELEGARDHLASVASDVNARTRDPAFAVVFPEEAATAQEGVRLLAELGERWLTRRSWVAYRARKDDVLELAEALRCRVVAMGGQVRPLIDRVEEREGRLQAAAQRVLSAQGAPDAWELLFARSGTLPDGQTVEDPKSDRVLRARFGDATVDWYEGLDGSWRMDAYGFSTSSDCDGRSRQMRELLTADVVVEEGGFDPDVRGPSPSTGPSWEGDAEKLQELTRKLKGELGA